jgi:hypothetical protein
MTKKANRNKVPPGRYSKESDVISGRERIANIYPGQMSALSLSSSTVLGATTIPFKYSEVRVEATMTVKAGDNDIVTVVYSPSKLRSETMSAKVTDGTAIQCTAKGSASMRTISKTEPYTAVSDWGFFYFQAPEGSEIWLSYRFVCSGKKPVVLNTKACLLIV